MKKKLFGVIAGVAALTFALSGCASGDGAIAMKYDDMIHADGSYDQSLFYRNDLKTECADPGAFYVSEEESYVSARACAEVHPDPGRQSTQFEKY